MSEQKYRLVTRSDFDSIVPIGFSVSELLQ